MNLRDIALEDATDFLRRSIDAAPTITRAFGEGEGSEVRVELRVTVDNGVSYAKMPWSDAFYVYEDGWYASKSAVDAATQA